MQIKHNNQQRVLNINDLVINKITYFVSDFSCMIQFPLPITDPVYSKDSFKRGVFDSFLMRFIKEERDLPFMRLIALIQVVVIPAGILLFTPLLKGVWWWAFAIPYFYVSQFRLKGSFGLMLHCLVHRKIFKKSYMWIQSYVLRFVCPFFGHLGESYMSHHMGMHHVEGNLPDDTSSTMGYQRDKLSDFLKYWLTFFFMGWRNTFLYLFGKKLPRFYVPLNWSEGLFLAGVVLLSFVNFKAAMVVFAVPFFFARFVMMLGNWAQHSFVDPNHPEDELSSTVVCINTNYNHKCWNDGYHAFHHFRQAAHYTEYPLMFHQCLDLMVEKKTLVFSGIHYLHIFLWLMGRRYDKLAKHVVNINGCFKNEEEVIELMKKRTKKFDLRNFEQVTQSPPVKKLAAA